MPAGEDERAEWDPTSVQIRAFRAPSVPRLGAWLNGK
jgi:hypothetical protein